MAGLVAAIHAFVARKPVKDMDARHKARYDGYRRLKYCTALVLLRRFARAEGAEIAPPPGARIFLARIKPVLPRLQLSDHRGVSLARLIPAEREEAARPAVLLRQIRPHAVVIGARLLVRLPPVA